MWVGGRDSAWNSASYMLFPPGKTQAPSAASAGVTQASPSGAEDGSAVPGAGSSGAALPGVCQSAGRSERGSGCRSRSSQSGVCAGPAASRSGPRERQEPAREGWLEEGTA